MPDPAMNEDGQGPDTGHICQTLADKLFAQTRKPSQVILFATPPTISDEARRHKTILLIDDIAPDFEKRLKELTARQTDLFNTDAPMQERILILNEIKEIQAKRRGDRK